MKFLIQRVNQAEVKCFDNDNRLIRKVQISKGLVVYIGISRYDIDAFEVNKNKYSKIIKLPFFDDETGKIKLSLQDISGELLLIPNFTLLGRNKKGINIDYTYSASFSQAKELFHKLYRLYYNIYNKVEKGIFGSYMSIDQQVDGPVNFIIDI